MRIFQKYVIIYFGMALKHIISQDIIDHTCSLHRAGFGTETTMDEGRVGERTVQLWEEALPGRCGQSDSHTLTKEWMAMKM